MSEYATEHDPDNRAHDEEVKVPVEESEDEKNIDSPSVPLSLNVAVQAVDSLVVNDVGEQDTERRIQIFQDAVVACVGYPEVAGGVEGKTGRIV